jgi:hypothetical protein
MPSYARKEIVHEGEVEAFHVYSRCVRRAFLCGEDPLTGNEEGDPAEVARANAHRRVSNKGFLSMSVDDYLRVLDWTGRQIRGEKHGAIPADLAPILERIGTSSESWLDTVTHFGRRFHRAAGRVSLLAREAARAGKRWFQGIGSCQQAFA